MSDVTGREVEEVLRAAIERWVVLADPPPLTGDSRLVEDLGLHSLALVAVVAAVEDTVGPMPFEDEELDDVTTVSELERLVVRNLGRETRDG